MSENGYDSLTDQLQNNKSTRDDVDRDIRQKSNTQSKATKTDKTSSLSTPVRKSVFNKGEQSIEIDDDYEFEIMADKKPVKLTLRELKERASGDIAIKNRMSSLAEEKKRIQSTFRQFTDLAKNDPLAALEFISNKAKETDSEFEYSKYIEKLAEQAEKLGQMGEEERKSWELQKKLAKAESDLSQKERMESVVLRKQELLADYPEVGDSQFSEMVDAVLSNEELLEGLETESDVMDRVEELIQETLTQRDIMTVIREINPDHIKNNDLIFSLSDQLKQNPDFDEEDVRDIVRSLIGEVERSPVRSVSSERQRDSETLSRKARQSTPVSQLRRQTADPYEILKEQLQERKAELSKTPLYKR